MNEDTYKLRREVIDLIYEAKETDPDLPRINVRITEDNSRTLGRARVGGSEKIIWIPKSTIQGKSHDFVRSVVFHEICHTAYGTRHDESCPLMKSIYEPSDSFDRETIRNRFKHYSER